jgi:Spy/CpxP family protein refolding chaperone
MKHLFHRRPRPFVTVAALAVAAALAAPAAMAHEGHGSCGEGATTFTKGEATEEEDPGIKDLATGAARDEDPGAGEESAELHQLCEPRPDQP